jgi:uncharacterized protein YlxW (UPF0749 family)
MSLLVDMMTNTLDESYAAAARRRAGHATAGETDGGGLRTGAGRRVIAVVLLVALGAVTGIGAAQVRKRQAASSGVRSELLHDVRQRTGETDTLAEQAARLRSQVAAERTAALTSNAAGAAVAQQLASLELAVGVEPVRGPGLVVRLDDAPGQSGPDTDRGGQLGQGRVQDRDLQDAVNGLWQAGAEAIAINGLRLSALTAIRSAGESILVDYRPVSPPYAVRAIGDPRRLSAGFADSASGRRLATYSSLYGLRIDISRTDRQTLAGAGTPSLRLAQPARGAS